MRLTKLHIINFGKLSDYTYNFEEGLNEAKRVKPKKYKSNTVKMIKLIEDFINK